MAFADRTSDNVLDKGDVDRDSRTAAAFMKLAGSESLTPDAVRGVVSRFAGKDGRLGAREFRTLSAELAKTTDGMKQPTKWPHQDPYTAEQNTNWLLKEGDVNFDGRVNSQDSKTGTDIAAILQSFTGTASLGHDDIYQAAVKFRPAMEPDASAWYFTRLVRDVQAEKIHDSYSLQDIASACGRVYDANQDMVLRPTDGEMARRTLADAHMTSMRPADVVRLFRKYDVVGADGQPGSDGRLTYPEWNALVKAQKPPAQQ
jgi:hypothetical protein